MPHINHGFPASRCDFNQNTFELDYVFWVLVRRLEEIYCRMKRCCMHAEKSQAGLVASSETNLLW